MIPEIKKEHFNDLVKFHPMTICFYRHVELPDFLFSKLVAFKASSPPLPQEVTTSRWPLLETYKISFLCVYDTESLIVSPLCP